MVGADDSEEHEGLTPGRWHGQTKENAGPSPAVDPARDFLDFWRNYFEQTAIQTRILLESMQGGKSPDQMHNQWLGSLSQSLESFMRTPAFLEVLKQSLKRMIDLKLLQDQMTQSVAQQTGLPWRPTSPASSSGFTAPSKPS